jgi:adenylate cyclase, class 2
MSLEVEAKLKLDSHQEVRARLQELHARPEGAVIETNRIFDDRDRTLRSAGSGLRLRTYRTGSGPAPTATLTFKGPQRQGTLKTREEIEVRFYPPDNGLQLLEALGYVEILCFEKRRETWRLDDCLVELDEVPYLGRYVEIEGPNEPAVLRMQALLGLADLPVIRRSYIALLTEHCQRHGLPHAAITFPTQP